ncbi:hypothetical protein, partial [Streptomyces goshikiensis]|uniref:hypothetical protein n=1 Tax=Streptomyces goshikiensis TaxID=1942 RepID=UPI003661E750
REHSTTSDARGSTTTAHFPAKISYTTQRDTIEHMVHTAPKNRSGGFRDRLQDRHALDVVRR